MVKSIELAIAETGVQTLVWKSQSKLWTPFPAEMKPDDPRYFERK
jgi:hypothetical protein